ncbi:MAG: hypothetical protein ACREJX_01895 [Polyangiaceae bacterium]
MTLTMCGSRTDLFDDFADGERLDAGDLEEGSSISTPDGTVEDARQARDAGRDGSRDASLDAPRDAPFEIADAGDAALPTIPGIDASVDLDSGTVCSDGGAPIVYLVSATGTFYSFDPPTLTAQSLGILSCPDSTSSSPFTMTVTQDAAYVLYFDGNLDRVDLSSLGCTATSFVPGELDFPGDVGVATSRSFDAGSEGLLVYGCVHDGGVCVPTLAKSNFTSFVLAEVGPLTPNPTNMGYPADISEDAYGRLFAVDASGYLIEVDSVTGTVLGQDATGLQAGAGWALLTWEDQLFFFTEINGTISTYDLATKQATTLGAVGDTIVGASAAPCIP